MVPKGRRHATSDIWTIGEAALRAISVACGTRGACDPTCAGVREIARQMGRSASTISRELRRNAATRSGGLDYRATTAQWHADRAAQRPKPVKLAVNVALRTYVQDRLAGVIVTPKGIAIAGPSVSWKPAYQPIGPLRVDGPAGERGG